MQITICKFRLGRRGSTQTERTMGIVEHPVFTFILLLVLMWFNSSSLAQTYPSEPDLDKAPTDYHESALRRFEIVFTASIPFAALHSYLAVRGVEMARQSKVLPTMSSTDWASVGGLTVLFSGFIAFWDYMHTRGEKIQDRGTPRNRTEPLAVLSTPLTGVGYMYRTMPREPVLRLLSARF